MDFCEESAYSATVPELIRSLKSALQNVYFSQIEDALVSREEKMKRDIEAKTNENKLLAEKLQLEVLEKVRAQKERDELKEVISRLREERDGFYEKLKNIADDKEVIIELERKNCELECAKLKAETEVEIYKRKFERLDMRVLSLEKDYELLERLEQSVSTSFKMSGEGLGEKAANGNDKRCQKPVEVKIEMDATINLNGEDRQRDKDSAGERIMSENEEVESRLNVGGKGEKLVNEMPIIACDEEVLLGTNAGPSCHSPQRNVTAEDDHQDKGERKMSTNEEFESRLNVEEKTEKLEISDGHAIDSEERVNLGTNAGSIRHSPQRSGTGGEKSLSDDIIEILDSDDEPAAPCNILKARQREIQGHLDKVRLGQAITENGKGGQKRTSASLLEKSGNCHGKDGSSGHVDDCCPVGKYKLRKIQEHVSVTSPVNCHT